MHDRKVGFLAVSLVVVAALVALVAPVSGQSFSYVLNMVRGETARITCEGAARLRIDRVNDRTVDATCGRVAEATATPAPAATATPTAMPPGTLAPVDPPSLLGTCSAETHDRYAVQRDGKTYRTWHPQTVTQADGTTCTFAHEHGDDPTTSAADNTLPAFGYVGELAGMSEAHEGFKVFVVHRGTVNDEGRTAQVDSRIVAHFGTSRQGRIAMPHHSLEYDMVAPGGEYVHVEGMADTGGFGDICERDAAGGAIGRTFFAVPSTTSCPANAPYEIWQFTLDLVGQDGDGALVHASVAAFDPATALDKGTGLAVVVPGALGCDREAYHGPVYWYQQSWSPVEFRTDAHGNRAPDGALVQQVSRHNTIGIPFSNDQTLFKLRADYCAPGLAFPN